MVEECKAWSFFKEGSYWVYEDSATGDIDSLFVYYSDEGETVSNGDTYFWFDCYLFSARDSFTYRYWFHSSWTSQNPYRSKVFRVKTKPGDPVGETFAFEYPIVPGNKLYDYGSATVYNVIETMTPLDSVNFANHRYFNVVPVTQLWDASEDSPGTYYWCKHTGVVRHEIDSANQKWNLIRYNTIQ